MANWYLGRKACWFGHTTEFLTHSLIFIHTCWITHTCTKVNTHLLTCTHRIILHTHIYIYPSDIHTSTIMHTHVTHYTLPFVFTYKPNRMYTHAHTYSHSHTRWHTQWGETCTQQNHYTRKPGKLDCSFIINYLCELAQDACPLCASSVEWKHQDLP